MLGLPAAVAACAQPRDSSTGKRKSSTAVAGDRRRDHLVDRQRLLGLLDLPRAAPASPDAAA